MDVSKTALEGANSFPQKLENVPISNPLRVTVLEGVASWHVLHSAAFGRIAEMGGRSTSQNLSGISFRGGAEKPFADKATSEAITQAIVNLRNAKDARNRVMFLKELGKAARSMLSLWDRHHNGK